MTDQNQTLPSPIIVRPKIRAPRVRPQLVVRAALIRRLNEGWWRKLTLICAQPGSGKTTLLSAWTGQLNIPAAWLTLDTNDNMIERFLVHLAASLDAALPGTGQPALALLHAPQPLDTRQWVNLLVNAVDQCGQKGVLIIDDYHTIHQLAIHEAMQYLLDQLPETLHLVIASRSEPPLPLARLRAQDQVTELRSEDLRFSIEEAEDFLNRLIDLHLERNDIIALNRQTEGWITGLQLAALALQSAPAGDTIPRQKPDPSRLAKLLSGGSRYLLDYLTEEVLRQQPEDVQTFLLETSLLERMNPGLCQAVTGRTDSATLLKLLDQQHLFIVPLDEENAWFRYHTLFADLLRYQLERSQPERAAELRAKAAGWLEDQGYNTEAINQYLNLKDYPQAARLAQKEGHQLLVQGQAALFNGWFKSLPDAVFQARPRLYLVHVFGLISIGQFGIVEDRLQALEQLIQKGADPGDMPGDIAAMRAIVASSLGHYPDAIEQAQQALALLPESSPMRCSILIGLGSALNFTGQLDEACTALDEAARLAQRNHQVSVVLSALCNKGSIELTQGKLRQAFATFQNVIETEKAQPARSPLTAMAHMGLAGIYYEWNDLERADASASAAIPLADQWGYVEMRALTRGRSAIIRQALGDPEGAAALMEAMEAVIREGKLSGDPSGNLFPMQLAYQIKARQVKQALQLAGEIPQAVGLISLHDLPFALTRAKIWLMQASAARNEAVLNTIRSFLNSLVNTSSGSGQQAFLLETWIALALVYTALGQDSAALNALERALALAEPEGYIRTFVDFGAPAAVLLRRSLPNSAHKPFVQSLLSAFDQEAQPLTSAATTPVEAVRTQPGLVEPLSEREIEVLRLTAEGLSNQEIADRLVIAQGTVKRHLHNIFEKLGAGTRPQAIAIARKAGVIA